MTTYTCEVNNQLVDLPLDLSRRLLDYLRIDLGLTGTKEGCQEGECGACLVLIDDQIVNACLVPVGNVVNHSVTTIEAFCKTQTYQQIEAAFLNHGGVQCGYCTPGMVMAVAALMHSGQPLTLETVKEGLSGNLCRCTGYQMIFDAVQSLDKKGESDA